MFCPKCGTKVNEDAKFCYNCGTKLDNKNIAVKSDLKQGSTKEYGKSENEFSEEYIKQIRSKLYEAYVERTEIDSNMFYKKAEFYQMSTEDIDAICSQTLKNIDKINGYINSIFEENNIPFLLEEQEDEIVQYVELYVKDKYISGRFLQRYFQDNHIDKKQELWKVIIDFYAKKGNVKKFSGKKRSDTLNHYIQILQKLKQRVSEKYAGDALSLDEKQRESLIRENIEFTLRPEDVENLICGYEIESGIYFKKMKAKKERVYSRVEMFSQVYKIYGKELTFGPKYFLTSIIENDFQDIFDKLCKQGENVQKLSSRIEDFGAIISDFENTYWEKVEYYEQLLEITLSDELNTFAKKSISGIKTDLERLKRAFVEIAQDELSKKERREEIKNERGRWSGGGFGIDGAIKGAVTAGAMNAATGLAYSGANLVGGMIASATAEHARNKKSESFVDSLEYLDAITDATTKEFCQKIEENYPELYFNPYADDTEEEKICRFAMCDICVTEEEDLSEEEKVEYNFTSESFTIEGKSASMQKMVHQLLLINPWNWRNGWYMMGFAGFGLYKEINDEERKALEELPEIFKWEDGAKTYMHKMTGVVSEAIEHIKKDKPVDDETYGFLQEYWLYMNILSSGSDELKKIEREVGDIIEQIEDVNAYNRSLSQVSEIPIEQVVNLGDYYYQQEKWNRVKNLYVNTFNCTEIRHLFEIFFEAQDKYKQEIIALLKGMMENEFNLKEGEYDRVIFALAHVKNKNGKAILEYAAEGHNDRLVDDLIKQGADVNVLYNLLGVKPKENSESKIFCSFCGAKISTGAKFCNFCGHKL